MAIGTYDELKSALIRVIKRPNLTSEAGDFVQLAEAKLNRRIPAVETDADLTGTVGSRRISLSGLSLVRPIALFIEVEGDEYPMTPQSDGTMAYDDTPGEPSYWAIDGTNIDFNVPCDQAYTFRLRYVERFALSDAAPTNWLLTNHPDVYLSAAVVWGYARQEDIQMAAQWSQQLQDGISEVRHELSKKKRGELTVDPMLVSISRHNSLDYYED